MISFRARRCLGSFFIYWLSRAYYPGPDPVLTSSAKQEPAKPQSSPLAQRRKKERLFCLIKSEKEQTNEIILVLLIGNRIPVYFLKSFKVKQI